MEDAVIFTINPEGLGPLFPQTSFKFVDEVNNVDNHLLQPKVENFLDDSQSSNILGETAMINDSTQANDELQLDSLMKPKLEAVEDDLQEQLQLSDKTMKSLKKEEEVYKEEKPLLDSKLCIREPWTLDTTLQFIQLLKDCPEMLLDSNDIPADTNNERAALHCIAQAMQRPLKSIEKRLCILKQTYDLEQEKILNNPLYKPPYKWWSEVKTLMESHNELKTESIYLEEENESLSTIPNDIEDDYEIRFENPIPSVAPMSNMNEAMAALFHEELSLGSNTNSTMPTTETESSHSGKVVWKGLEDDLLEGKWSLKHSVKFLRLYGVHRCLWDLNDPDYRSRPLRNAAIEDIAASMGYGLTATYVAKKIKIFRITYMQQRKRILDAIEKGKCPEILLKWFPLADSFLRPHIGLRSIKSDAKAKEMPQFDFQYVYANLNLIDPALLNDFRGKGSQNTIDIGNEPSMNSDGEEC